MQSYEIIVLGHLESRWSDWLAGLSITRLPDGRTSLRGSLVDQSALHGVLEKIRDMGLELVYVSQTDQGVKQ